MSVRKNTPVVHLESKRALPGKRYAFAQPKGISQIHQSINEPRNGKDPAIGKLSDVRMAKSSE